jgi:hypothetical protein
MGMSYAAAQFWTEWFTLRVAALYDLDAGMAAQCMLCGHGEELE